MNTLPMFSVRRAARLVAVVMPALLGSCGSIRTPSLSVRDAHLTLPASAPLGGRVVYLETDVMSGNSVPDALKQVTVRGNATYRTAGAGTLSALKLYVRPTLDTLPATCVTYPATASTPRLVVCDAAAEGAQFIGTMNVRAGQTQPFTLGGPALDSAARSGHGFFGVEFTAGQSLFMDTLDLTGMQASARL